ncbi:MAG TPA: hypothetical protein VFS57_07005, partial [Gemmatimonadaceae bacterium]|nr:hypothetical protein [Gemmatimonadaceae bacterium]
ELKGSFALNNVAPAAGVPGAPGPIWSHLAGAPGLGSAAAEKVPISLSITTESAAEGSWKGDCTILDPGTRRTKMKGAGQASVPMTEMRPELMAQGMFTISADLKTYDLVFGVGRPKVKEVTQIHEETGAGCPRGKVSVKDTTETREEGYGVPSIELKGMPLPATVSTFTGTKKLRLKFGDREGQMESTVTWTFTPIR